MTLQQWCGGMGEQDSRCTHGSWEQVGTSHKPREVAWRDGLHDRRHHECARAVQSLAAKGLNQALPQSGTAHHLSRWHEIWVRVECWQHLFPACCLLHGLPVSNHAALPTSLNTYGQQKAGFSTALPPSREVSSSHSGRYACRIASELPALACAYSSSHRWARIAPDHTAHVACFLLKKTL